MISILGAVGALVGGICAVVFTLTGGLSLAFTLSKRMPGQQPRLSEENKNALIGSLLFIVVAALAALVTKLMVGWTA